MTLIVGLEHNNKVFMGWDSSSTDGWLIRQTSLRKVFHRGPFMIGYAGSFRLGQIIQYHLPIPEAGDYKNDEEFMVSGFIEGLRMALKEHGGISEEDKQDEMELSLLVAYKGRLYQVEQDLQINHYRYDNFAATGTGEQVALGVLAALSVLTDLSPPDRIKLTLEIAGRMITSICPPYHTEVQK